MVQSTGKGGYDDAVAALDLSGDEGARWQVRSYIDDMGDVLAAADLVLSRAGASSVAEIAALAVPSIPVSYTHLVPSCDVLIKRFAGVIGERDLVLVKGSRFVGLDRFVEEVCADAR